MTYTPFGLRQMADAAENMNVALSYAETALQFIALLQADRDHVGHLGFEAVCHLCGQGLSHVLHLENDKVEHLVAHLRKEADTQDGLPAHLGVGARSALEGEE